MRLEPSLLENACLWQPFLFTVCSRQVTGSYLSFPAKMGQ